MLDTSIKWSKFIPFEASIKQKIFLSLPHDEILYGGAAGGGKSVAMLMAALQYVDVPGYSALIIRRTMTEAKESGAPLALAHSWLQGWPKDEVRFVPSEHTYYFSTYDEDGNYAQPSTLQFGYLGQQNSSVRYQGAQLQFVGFDELTQHQEADYVFFWSRTRKPVCPKHKVDSQGRPIFSPDCYVCRKCSSLPIRYRATANPGGVGHEWVKKRFGIIENPDKTSKYKFIGHPEIMKVRPFLPSFYTDNPGIDVADYGQKLEYLDDLRKQQLKYGDWSASADARFKKDYFRYYSMRGSNYALGLNGEGSVYPRGAMEIFGIIDPAMSTKAGPNSEQIYRNAPPSYTVISIWGITPDRNLLLLWVTRFREEAPEVLDEIMRIQRQWRPQYFAFEENQGRALLQFCQRNGIMVRPIWTSTDKITNSIEAQQRAKAGKIWFPHESLQNHWLPDWEGEIFNWTGLPWETDDQVDVLSNAVRNVVWDGGEPDYVWEDDGDESNATPYSDSPSWVYGVNDF